ncbi:hypothetical protein Q3G72_033794 [Acer saccharum]|nr:hypothetical protein Q3G72_033794 [Acer saccharum]
MIFALFHPHLNNIIEYMLLVNEDTDDKVALYSTDLHTVCSVTTWELKRILASSDSGSSANMAYADDDESLNDAEDDESLPDRDQLVEAKPEVDVASHRPAGEQPKQLQTSFKHGYDRVRSNDTFETTGYFSPSSELSGTLDYMSKSPTIKSSHAYYDGSVSSFDGTDGQVPEKHVKSYQNPNKFVSYVASYFDVIDDQVPEKHVKSYKNPNYHSYPERYNSGRNWSHWQFSTQLPPPIHSHSRGLCSFHPCRSYSSHRSCPSSHKQFTDSEFLICYWEMKSDDQGHEEYHVKRHVKEQTHLVKRHLLPTAGGAPFVICYRCLKPRQLPADFLLFKRRFHQIKCGSINKNQIPGSAPQKVNVSCVSTSLKIKDMSAEVTAWLDTSAKARTWTGTSEGVGTGRGSHR